MSTSPWMIPIAEGLADEILIAELVRRGYRKPQRETERGWETLTDLARRLGRELKSLSRTIARNGGTVPGLEIERSNTPARNIRRVRASDEFYTWIKSLSPQSAPA